MFKEASTGRAQSGRGLIGFTDANNHYYGKLRYFAFKFFFQNFLFRDLNFIVFVYLC